mgnify:CR=1 FL=1
MQESGINWKAIRTLNGVFALHDGPNCYNSTLIAKGYTQIISQTGDEELKYYLWTFCDRENGPPKVGDIIVKTVGAESEIEHAATYIGSGKIFEKLSSAGIDGYFAHSPPGVFHGNLLLSSQYTIRKIKDSSYFTILAEERDTILNFLIDSEATLYGEDSVSVIGLPDIIIFDEATSSVDNKTEQLIQKALFNIQKGRTSIIIAHRLSTIRNCSTIFLIKDGKVFEKGNHESLVNDRNSYYSQLWNIQTGKKN